MAIPKVFVSSTCYDLQEERAQLERFINGYGFQPVLSEYSGVYYDVDAHTHESCVNEVVHCDLFVLIISGRYGGKYKGGNGESITQAEYNKAKELGLPIFTFVKADVFNAQHYYKTNIRTQGDEFAKRITYPAIEKQDDAVSIFSFIETVSHASTNNGVETYHSFVDIENHLKKQWAGMFFTFLKKRKEQENVENILSAVQKLVGTTTTLESLVESLHTSSIGEEETKLVIKSSEIRKATFKFYEMLVHTIAKYPITDKKGAQQLPPLFLDLDEVKLLIAHPIADTLDQYLTDNPVFFIDDIFNLRGQLDKSGVPYPAFDAIGYKKDARYQTFIDRDYLNELEKNYLQGVKNASLELRTEAINSSFAEHSLPF
ncbi:DUF4062 domain-containing protein [Vibrio fluvialis]|nr:DUF4062 domain-containing protein [Vibrio fluvialis]